MNSRPAGELVDAIGVNVHFGHEDTAYVQRFTEVKALLRELGVRHVRDGACVGCLERRARQLAVRDELGIRFGMALRQPERQADGTYRLWGTDAYGVNTVSDGESVVNQIATLAGPMNRAIESVEAYNEYDLSGDPAWATRLRDDQLAARATMRQIGFGVPLLAPAVTWPSSHTALAAAGFDPNSCDTANRHIYTGGSTIEQNGLFDSVARDAYGVAGAGKPLITTEIGFHDDVGAVDPGGHVATTASAAGLLVPRCALDLFFRGVPRSHSYELIDEPTRPGMEAHFGLLRSDLSRKPAFIALRNLISVLKIAGETTNSRPLDVSVQGSSTVRSLLLDHGGFQRVWTLVLWRNVPVYDQVALRDLPVTTERVTVTLPVGVKAWSTIAPGAGQPDPQTGSTAPHTVRLRTGGCFPVAPRTMAVDLRFEPILLRFEL